MIDSLEPVYNFKSVEAISIRMSNVYAQRKEYFIRYCVFKFLPESVRQLALNKDYFSVKDYIIKNNYKITETKTNKIAFIKKELDGTITILETLEAP